MERYGPDANYLVVSDHGFGAIYRWVYVNNLLAQNGLLVVSQFKALADVLTRKAKFSNETRTRLGLHSPDAWPDPAKVPLVDFSRTLAFAGPQLEHAVYVNVKGRFPGGTVEPGEPYRRVKRRIIDALSQATDPTSGERVFVGVYDRDEIYHGDFVDEAPDVVFDLAPGYMVSNVTLPSLLRRGFLRDVGGGWQYSGYHLPDGVIVGWGPAFRRTKNLRAEIVDVAPTVMYLLGLPIPNYMDGRVIEDSLMPGLLELRAPEFRAVDPTYDRATSPIYTPEQQLEVTRRLEQLGYL
jgi:predicted AlkP superfamily phosphohydrolase/phosphomutase